MAEYVDLGDAFDGDLHLPWNGTMWRVPEPSAKESERLRMLAFTAEMSGDTEVYEIRKLLGQTWNDLIDADMGWSHLLHFGRTALLYFTNVPEIAEHYWHLGRLMTMLDLDVLADQVKRKSA